MIQEEEGTALFWGSLSDYAAFYAMLAKMRGSGLSVLALSTSEEFSPRSSGEPYEREVNRLV